ncbi:Tether containing UBX domain for GLUT4, partial [Modicella reniformis]
RLKKAKPATEVYLLPIVILLEREYVSIKTLKTTTLQLAGLLKGNAVFRVLMRFTDAGIEDFMEDIERDYTQPATTTTNDAEPTREQMSLSSSPELAPTTATQSPLQDMNTAMIEVNQEIRQQTQAALIDRAKRPELDRIKHPQLTASPPHGSQTDKTAGESYYMMSMDAYPGAGSGDMSINSQGVQTPHPQMTTRSGSIDGHSREGNMIAPTQGPSADIDIQRQSPLQDMNTAMIEANQEIRQLREQQTQAALTDRVKRLSKAADNSDRERFVRSLPPGTFTEEPVCEEMDVDTSSVPKQDELVRQIAHRVSMQLKQAQERGISITDYSSLIAQEIEKKQKAGELPTTPTGSRNNTIYRSKAEEEASHLLIATPPATINRNVRVFRPPADEAAPLSDRIDLPDDFYNLTSQDVMKIMEGQKAKRDEEENRGFKTAAVRAEEEKARERRYPKTIIRIRFPDRVQVQATFRSQETIGDVRKWVASVCVGHGEKFDLFIAPPRKVLSDNKQTLYQAGLAPQSIVYFSWTDSKLNKNSPFLNGEYMEQMEDLPIPGTETEEAKKVVEGEENAPPSSSSSTTGSGGGHAFGRTGTIPLNKEEKRMSARMSTEKPGSGSGLLPKWVKSIKK